MVQEMLQGGCESFSKDGEIGGAKGLQILLLSLLLSLRPALRVSKDPNFMLICLALLPRQLSLVMSYVQTFS